MSVVGLRELRQQASELVRRVEAGDEVTITVSGRPTARLVPVAPRTWRRWEELAGLFAGAADTEWEQDRDRIDEGLAREMTDRWAAR